MSENLWGFFWLTLYAETVCQSTNCNLASRPGEKQPYVDWELRDSRVTRKSQINQSNQFYTAPYVASKSERVALKCLYSLSTAWPQPAVTQMVPGGKRSSRDGKQITLTLSLRRTGLANLTNAMSRLNVCGAAIQPRFTIRTASFEKIRLMFRPGNESPRATNVVLVLVVVGMENLI